MGFTNKILVVETNGNGFVEDTLFGNDDMGIVGIIERWNPANGDWNPTTDSHGNGGIGGNGGTTNGPNSVINRPFGGPNSVFNNPFGITAGGAGTGGPNSFVNNPNGSGLDAPPDAPPPDPTLESVKAGQVADAKSYRANLPQTQQNMYEQAYKGERNNLAQNIQATRQNANSRGLLYSGLEQGNEQGQRANSNANLAQTRSEINNSTESQARQLEANAVQTGIQQQQSVASIQDQTMSQALANMAARRQGLSGVGQGIGAGIGIYAANNPNRPTQTNYGLNQPTQYGT